MTEILVVIKAVCEVSKSLETPSNVILLLSFKHCKTLGQVIKGLEFWSRDIHQSVDQYFGWRHIIVPTLFCSVRIVLSILKHFLLGCHSEDGEGGIMKIQLSVQVFKIHHCFFWEFRECIAEVAKLAEMVRELVQEMHVHKVEL
jgi:hypothetical protein